VAAAAAAAVVWHGVTKWTRRRDTAWCVLCTSIGDGRGAERMVGAQSWRTTKAAGP